MAGSLKSVHPRRAQHARPASGGGGQSRACAPHSIPRHPPLLLPPSLPSRFQTWGILSDPVENAELGVGPVVSFPAAAGPSPARGLSFRVTAVQTARAARAPRRARGGGGEAGGVRAGSSRSGNPRDKHPLSLPLPGGWGVSFDPRAGASASPTLALTPLSRPLRREV